MKRYHARATQCAKISEEIANEFIERTHSQGALKTKGSTANVGLYAEDQLVAVAQFGPPRTAAMKRVYTTELYRMAFEKEMRIVGGASKLLSFYRKTFRPADIFTYQDTTGEGTRVYEHCGFTLVRQDKKKQYLVAPGKTLETASRKEALGMAYATRYGPDRILGTKLGEVLRADGSRKSNKEIFIEELGWHIEETTGDRLYEWVNPDITFYTYRITATDSDKYYYGVSHVKKANATVEDCLNDGYFGTGGGRHNRKNKYSNWKAKHSETLVKEIISLHRRKAEAYLKEKQLVSDLWATDPLCLNSTSGGKLVAVDIDHKASFTQIVCDKHGLTTHRGVCLKCRGEAIKKVRECPTHGETIHFGETCCKCSSAKNVSLKECELHGLSTFFGPTCRRCSVAKLFNEGTCEHHGRTLFRGESCMKCVNQANVTTKVCSEHGVTKHIGGKCYHCRSMPATKIDCETHGISFAIGDTCLKCALVDRDSLAKCKIHGEVLHRGGQCITCTNNKSVTIQECAVHGEQKFIGKTCYRCRESADRQDFCPEHGNVTFRGDSCLKCSMAKATTMQNCPVHGLTKHRGASCYKCSAARGATLKECPIHGMTKFQGKSCRRCAAEKTAHKRSHKVHHSDCRFCNSN